MAETQEILLPKVATHAERLATSTEPSDQNHRQAARELADWIVARLQSSDQPVQVIVICTGNSRRSILGATMGNIASAYFGLPEIRFHSGGTEPTAFNPRTIHALEEIGVLIAPTGEEAPRGTAGASNPIYLVRWGKAEGSAGETIEFSKTYDDASNPTSGFAALMVCGEADAGCPRVEGADMRISIPFLDPKTYDDTPLESLQYAERRDAIGRLMMAAMSQVRHQLDP